MGHDAAVLTLHDVHKSYDAGGRPVRALAGVSLTRRSGTFTAVMGPSGSGKSTLLQCAAGLDLPTSGSVLIDGVEVTTMSETARTKLRRRRVGFIFQELNLLPTLSVAENAGLPLRFAGHAPDQEKVRAILTRVGIGGRMHDRPAELSGGQQQRVAIARTLLAEPAVTFADEPTGALDTASARDVLDLLSESVRVHGRTVVMVTHDPVAASYADEVLFLADGRFVDALASPSAAEVAARMADLRGDVVEGR
ncbi:ABC transporter ATP-binding protein [Mumia zhuanghuii]|uniref:ABC transporter ATP-binding protein n=1 Tax=Mumia zhuanghuii TaxID=2585211 RepID=A0A5C4ME47_9ACTN|nr:ABC transporter ATP-binding protein [Mumia zhuanghuii]TNC32841.1 ABC transporter ATP-binding protein [Mumia zhuanghuii]TNC42429.1 ABC transporter ATP-binding protein [Mumia zhuanghuii]